MINIVIHRVAEGETIYSISAEYGISAERITQDNQLQNPDSLVVGQTIVIHFPLETYTVAEGDTLEKISEKTGVPVLTLRRNNPVLNTGLFIYPGQTLVLEYTGRKLGNIDVLGYAYTYIEDYLLAQTMPFLTYMNIFSYGITPSGGLIPADDERIIAYAKEYGVKPILVLTSLNKYGVFSSETVSMLLADKSAQDRLIENVSAVLNSKGYYGLDVDIEFIEPQYAEEYAAFLGRLRIRLNSMGMVLFTALAPKISADQTGLLYEGHNYRLLGEASDYVFLMTYEWGYTYGPPMAVAPINNVKRVVDYALTEIPAEKIFMGIPNYGYDWSLPYISGESKAESISNVRAVQTAEAFNAEILYDITAQSPHFNYFSSNISPLVSAANEHEVWFEDAESIRKKLELLNENNLRGGGYWNLMRQFPQNWLVLNSLFNINNDS